MFPKPPDPEALTLSLLEILQRSLSSGVWNGLAFLLGLIALVVQFTPRPEPRRDFESWSGLALATSSLWLRMVGETWVRLGVFSSVVVGTFALMEWGWHAATGDYLNDGAKKLVEGLVVTKFSIVRHLVSTAVLLALFLAIILFPAALLSIISHCQKCLEDNLVWITLPVTLGFWVWNGVVTSWRLWAHAPYIRAFFSLPDKIPNWGALVIGIVLSVVLLLFTHSVLWVYLRFITRAFSLKSPEETLNRN